MAAVGAAGTAAVRVVAVAATLGPTSSARAARSAPPVSPRTAPGGCRPPGPVRGCLRAFCFLPALPVLAGVPRCLSISVAAGYVLGAAAGLQGRRTGTGRFEAADVSLGARWWVADSQGNAQKELRAAGGAVFATFAAAQVPGVSGCL